MYARVTVQQLFTMKHLRYKVAPKAKNIKFIKMYSSKKVGDSAPKWPLDPDVIWQHFPVYNDEAYLRGQDDVIWKHSCVGGMTNFTTPY